MEKALSDLKQLVNAIEPFSEADWEAFVSLWKLHTVGRKEQLSVPGEAERYLYYVVEGIQRVYYFDEMGREATLVFTYPPSFGGVLDSMMTMSPSRYYYETLSPSIFLRAPYAEIDKLSRENKSLERMILKGIVASLSGVLERLVEVQCYSSEEKFRKLLSRSPHILQLIPHKYLANYLGIDATNFSKLINKVKI